MRSRAPTRSTDFVLAVGFVADDPTTRSSAIVTSLDCAAA